RPAVVLGLALVLQPRAHLRQRLARLPGARLPAPANDLDRDQGPAAPGLPAGVAGLGARGGDGLRRRVQGRPQRAPVERDRRRVRRADRRRPDRARPVAVRALSGRGRPEALRAGRPRRRDPRADPGERPLRVGEPERGHVRARLVPRLHPGARLLRLEREVGQPSGRALHVDRLRPAVHGRPRSGRLEVRPRSTGGDARVRVGGLSVHPVRVELEHERRDHARVPDLRLLARHLPVGARHPGRAGVLDEVRRAPGRSAVGDLSRGPAQPPDGTRVRGRVRARHRGELLDPPAGAEPPPRRPGVLGSHDRVAGRPGVAVLDLGLAPVPRRGHPRPRLAAEGLPGPARRRRAPRAVPSPPEVAAAAGRADRGAADRLRGRPDALVLPLPPVVLRLRRVRGAGRRASGRHRSRDAARRTRTRPQGQDRSSPRDCPLTPEAADSRRATLIATLALGILIAGWVGMHHGFYRHSQIADTPIYQRYGDAIARGQVPYRDFALEYPPAALPAFALPSLLRSPRGDLARYEDWFEAEMLFCGGLALVFALSVLLDLRAGPGRIAAALGFVAVAPLLLGSVVLSRFDLWLAALVTGALAALVAGRNRLGSGVLGVAFAAKLFPAGLLPLAVGWVWRQRGRREAVICLAVFVAVVLACFVPFVAVAPHGVWDALTRQTNRPLQIESLGAG